MCAAGQAVPGRPAAAGLPGAVEESPDLGREPGRGGGTHALRRVRQRAETSVLVPLVLVNDVPGGG
jgi:hypothetical protein